MKIQDYINNVKSSIESLKEYAISGEIQPFEALAEIKQNLIDDDLKECIKEVQSQSIEELEKNWIDPGKKSFKNDKYVFTVRKGSTRYYFTEIDEFKKQQQKAKNSPEAKKLKEIESKYKSAFMQKQKGLAMFDEETGEEIDVSKVNVVYSSDSVTVKAL